MCKINFINFIYPSYLFRSEIVDIYSDELLFKIEIKIKSFMMKNRKYFNDKFKYEKFNEFYKKILTDKDEYLENLKH